MLERALAALLHESKRNATPTGAVTRIERCFNVAEIVRVDSYSSVGIMVFG
jgi:hypothetical protein